MVSQASRIVIAGAGSIGCYVGGCLALAGREVTLLARPRIATALTVHGLRVTDLEGGDRELLPDALDVTSDPQTALAGAEIVLVTVKSGATSEMAALIDRFAPRDAIIVSLQNGVENASRIGATLTAPRPVISGMVPFNVVLNENGSVIRVHRATEGAVTVQAGQGLAAILGVEGLLMKEAADMRPILWGKLLLNLNNALNALSDLPLATQLSDRRWRKLLAAQMDEALTVMQANGIAPARLAGVAPSLLPTILRLPNWLFSRAARRMLAIDPEARSSMWEDFQQRRPTEIDEFQGTVQRLATASGTPVPLTRRVVELVRQAEAANEGPAGINPGVLAG